MNNRKKIKMKGMGRKNKKIPAGFSGWDKA